jgi:hypothetical protein
MQNKANLAPGRVKANCSYSKGLGEELVHNASAKTKPISRTGIACPALVGGRHRSAGRGGRNGRKDGGHSPPYKRTGDNAQNKAKLGGDGLCGQRPASDCRTDTRVPALCRGHKRRVVRLVRRGGCVWTPDGGGLMEKTLRGKGGKGLIGEYGNVQRARLPTQAGIWRARLNG